ncbi:hypothetical protein PTTG_25341 [Puccinia triticina 1-1 BBBD Race 1]|uniref:Uncharacterized protein n=2 Tax=Puccinia triticina TaxID=208348 RepID=A0A180H3S5_PUCT1|nr:uncharacterized protein PtA15_8A566 [Puccinia triticina]OAV99298.1 hypothetical protein PTTG_25341 [Puccinia triticina 1-1 BBBD Race 1]WAQ87660.1 hypothetical protein PtA15_8A566 [Puccinia triticina]WAR57520.1 hypothetical protein PtB15_8B570 [Puccinia triticina]
MRTKMEQKEEELNLLNQEFEVLENLPHDPRAKRNMADHVYCDFIRKYPDFLSIFKKLKLCKILGVNNEFSEMEHLIEFLAQQRKHYQLLKDLPEPAFPIIAKYTMQKHATLFLVEIKKLLGGYKSREHFLQNYHVDYKYSIPYLLKAISFLLKNQYIDGDGVRRLFQRDEVLWITNEHIMDLVQNQFPTGKDLLFSGIDVTENRFWPVGYDYLEELNKHFTDSDKDKMNLKAYSENLDRSYQR